MSGPSSRIAVRKATGTSPNGTRNDTLSLAGAFTHSTSPIPPLPSRPPHALRSAPRATAFHGGDTTSTGQGNATRRADPAFQSPKTHFSAGEKWLAPGRGVASVPGELVLYIRLSKYLRALYIMRRATRGDTTPDGHPRLVPRLVRDAMCPGERFCTHLVACITADEQRRCEAGAIGRGCGRPASGTPVRPGDGGSAAPRTADLPSGSLHRPTGAGGLESRGVVGSASTPRDGRAHPLSGQHRGACRQDARRSLRPLPFPSPPSRPPM